MRSGDFACAILRREGRVLLGKRSAERRTYPNCWDVLGGRVEIGETVEQALQRELQEEVGLTPTVFTKFASIREPRPERNGVATYHFFLVDSWIGGEPTMHGDEHVELRWFTVDEACGLSDLALPEYANLLRSMP